MDKSYEQIYLEHVESTLEQARASLATMQKYYRERVGSEPPAHAVADALLNPGNG